MIRDALGVVLFLVILFALAWAWMGRPLTPIERQRLRGTWALKRSPLRRGTPLARLSALRRTPMKRRPRRARPGRDDEAYIEWVRRQPCCAPSCGRRAPSDPHHKPGAGMGARSQDHEAIPMCRLDHDDIDVFRGRFAGWTREQRAEWHHTQAKEHRARYLRERASTRAARPGL